MGTAVVAAILVSVGDICGFTGQSRLPDVGETGEGVVGMKTGAGVVGLGAGALPSSITMISVCKHEGVVKQEGCCHARTTTNRWRSG